MDVIINNAAPGTPVQVIPQQSVPQQYIPQQSTPSQPAPFGPGDGSDDGPGGFFLVVLILGAVIFFRRRRQQWRGEPSSPDGAGSKLGGEVRDTFRRGRARLLGDHPLDLARERYAKGEINADEYETLRRTLSGEPARGPASGGDAPLNI